MMAARIHARVLAYKGYLLCEATTPNTIEGECVRPDSGARGCVTFNTEKHLGVSQEAIDLMAEVRVGKDDIGNVAWFDHPGQGTAFAWLGGPCVAMNPATIEAAAEFAVRPGKYVLVPNDVPEPAKGFVEALKAREQTVKEFDAAQEPAKAIWSSEE